MRFSGDAAFRKRVMDMGVTPMGGTADEVTSYIGQRIEPLVRPRAHPWLEVGLIAT